jgi:hypothetical protein
MFLLFLLHGIILILKVFKNGNYAVINNEDLIWVTPYKDKRVLINKVDKVSVETNKLLIHLNSGKKYNLSYLNSNNWKEFKHEIEKKCCKPDKTAHNNG